MKTCKRLLGVLLIGTSIAAGAGDVNVAAPLQPNTRGTPLSGFSATGAARFEYMGDRHIDSSGWGYALQSNKANGRVSYDVKGLDAKSAKWYRFTFRGLAESGFAVAGSGLTMQAAFFGDHGKTEYDAKAKPLYTQIETARRDLNVNGRERQNGAAVWQTYSMDFSLPFPQVDEVRLSVGFDHGSAGAVPDSDFFIDSFNLVAIPTPANAQAPATLPLAIVPQGNLIPIGGRWFYAAKPGETVAPKRFDTGNADRLLYHDTMYSAPFAGNTYAYLRPGNKDASGRVVTESKLISDNVVIEFDSQSMIIHTHGVPNHPTGTFPEPQFGNPSYIQDEPATYYFPLNPTENPNHQITSADNSNHALHMGPIGLAVNGVVFFNPFDMGNRDAADLMDRCCGHPNPDNQYHYHKYPICINSPWADEGKAHSPLIGFAFDGYPVYGPYESADIMAKDVVGQGALSGFNMHYDAERGWHYHATPGKFPYIIGGFWGIEDQRDRPHGPPGGGPGNRRFRGGPGGEPRDRAPGDGPPVGPQPPFDGPPPR